MARAKPDAAMSARASEAVRVFRQLQPTLNSFARTFTGNPRIRVEAHKSATGTDGHVIYYRVPLSLADMGSHRRSECGKRDVAGHQVCNACDQRELVMVTIYHEISHVVSGSVEALSDSQRAKLVEESVPWLPEVVRIQVRRALMNASFNERASYAHVASLISKWLPFLINSIEDARVDAAMYAARPGTLAMKLNQMSYLRDDGIEQQDEDGNYIVMHWPDYPVNSQVSLGTYFMASSLDPVGWFCDEVNEALTDERLREIVNMPEDATAESIYHMSVKALVRLWEMGYLEPPQPPEDDEESGDGDSEEAEDANEGDGGGEQQKDGSNGSDDGSGSGGVPQGDRRKPDGDESSTGEGDGTQAEPGTGEPSGDVSAGPEGDSEDSDDGTAPGGTQGAVEDARGLFDEASGHRTTLIGEEGGEAEDEGAPAGVAVLDPDSPAEENALGSAILVGSYFETASRGVSEVNEHYWDSRDEKAVAWDVNSMWRDMFRGSRYVNDFVPSEFVLGPALLRMRAAFADNQRYRYQRNLKSGRIAGRVLGKRAVHDDPRLFQARRVPGKRSYFVMIAMDVSGSTCHGNLSIEKRAVMAQAELLSRSGVPFSIVAHSADYAEAAKNVSYSLELYHVKDESEPWDMKTKHRLAMLAPHSGNLDGHMLEYMRRAADASNATDKVLLYYSDGKFPATNADEEKEVLLRELDTVKRRGYTLLGVGINTDSPREYGMDTVEVYDDAGIVAVVRGLEERLAPR